METILGAQTSKKSIVVQCWPAVQQTSLQEVRGGRQHSGQADQRAQYQHLFHSRKHKHGILSVKDSLTSSIKTCCNGQRCEAQQQEREGNFVEHCFLDVVERNERQENG